MYEFILWMCVAGAPACPVYNSVQNRVMIKQEKTKEDCETEWKNSLTIPDPEGMKSYHKCQPVSEDL